MIRSATTGLLVLLIAVVLFDNAVCIFDSMVTSNDNYDSDSQACSREQSRRVRHFVDTVLMAKFTKSFKYDLEKLPATCLLNPERDLFREQEKHKLQSSTHQWDCLACGKKFKSEFYLDRHMQLHHPEKLRNGTDSNGAVCLGDMCPVFGCQMFRKTSVSAGTDLGGSVNSYRLHQKEQAEMKSFDEVHTCTQEDVATLKQQCHEIMSTCFQDHPDMMKYSEQTVCGLLSCDNGLLKGSLKDASVENDELDSSWWIFQAIFLIVGGLFFAVYMCTNGSIPGFRLTKAASRSGHSESRRSKFQALHYAPTTSKGVGRSLQQQNSTRNGNEVGWFFKSLVNPIKREIQDVFKTSKD